tara:strand:+ start:4246 stop:4584 length:339 start_codon:yes stop_codon:yes gene_type:complete
MDYYIIKYGLSGGFNSYQYEVIQTVDLEDAEKWAWENACDEYDNMSGLHGLRSEEEIMEEEDCDEEEARDIYWEEREGWINYFAKPFSRKLEDELEAYHYSNEYQEITDKLD